MSVQLNSESSSQTMLNAAIQAACDSIAPNWPLDKMIAVNPYWSWVDKPFTEAAHYLAQFAGSPMAMSLSYYHKRWQAGEISQEDLAHALASSSAFENTSLDKAIDALTSNSHNPVPAPLLCDTLDSERDLHKEPAWCDTITHQVAQFCAAYFDKDQADWHPHSRRTLYQSWRETMRHDHSVALLMKAPSIPKLANNMAKDPRAQIAHALEQLHIAPEQWQDYLQAVMYRVSGWASWCAYQKWQANLAQQQDHTLIELLAIRLSWECLVDDKKRDDESVWQHWQRQWGQHFADYDNDAMSMRLLWQRAHELSYQRQLSNALTQPRSLSKTTAKVQAVFCIDVRSEVIRRHLEAQSNEIETLGFAGFFGLPVDYAPLATRVKRPQLPGLLAPQMSICDSAGCDEKDAVIAKHRKAALQRESGWVPFNTMPSSAFTLVEALGLTYVAKLIKRVLPISASHPSSPGLSAKNIKQLRPTLSADLEQQITLAEGVLKGMALVGKLAPMVLLVGHGSENANNPQRAGLDCGACCGQTGEVNARALAQILNNTSVREGLKLRGVEIPEATQFVAALHNTTTDDITLFDTEHLAHDMQQALCQLQNTLDAASSAARVERAPQLGLDKSANDAKALQAKVTRRTNDWAQTRPEWGLANNAAFIIAPRERTRGLKLDGRTFMHEYNSAADADAGVLAQIMTAPMVVTNWINMQYFASTVDNHRYGSGNKTLHNVVGGRMGVFEGNGGDLRIGLSMQSLHDGTEWRHEPLRLTVVIDAPEQAIASVINNHDIVKQLVDNQWLYLARFDGDTLAFYEGGEWQAPFAK
ncbi:YbcC family protein [Pseudoalteromonas sp. SSDWG2]|uniref:YbcC family protein n=1 Tax=Pseudoalteromonas sp. SSDWG2 TaxID=3139391 RepID=UPI003BACC9FB